MFELKIALRRLFRKGEFTLPRLLSLIAGLAFGILLFSEVLYYYSVNRFYPDSDRVYEVTTEYKMGTEAEEYQKHPRTSGAVATGLKAEVPGVENATRLNPMGTIDFYTNDKKSYSASFVFADGNLGDVLPRKMLTGKSKDILTRPMTCMVSSEIAEQIGSDVIGTTIEVKAFPGKKLTIGGVFEAIPENTSFSYDVAISMISTDQFTWDGSNNWVGNDRYYTCVKLKSGIDPKSLAPAVREMQIKYQDIETLEKENNISLRYQFVGLEETFVLKVKTMILVLSAIGFLVLLVSLMNYVLLTFNALVQRLKGSAVYKTCGAETSHLYRLIFSETIVFFVIALVGAGFVILAVKPFFEDYVDHQLSSVLTQQVLVPLGIGMVLVVFFVSYLPGRYFSRTPILAAFRGSRMNRNKWKLTLLGLQFVGVSFIVSILFAVTMQYNVLTGSDHGFQVQGVYHGSTSGMNPSKINVVLDKLEAMPEVEVLSLCEELPLGQASGNNIKSIDGTSDLFNVADFYYIDQNYLPLLGMTCAEGTNFRTDNAQKKDLLMSQKGADLLRIHNNWDDVVGHSVEISELGGGTIRGVYPDFVINSFSNFDERASVFHYQPRSSFVDTQIEDPSVGFKIAVKIKEGMESGVKEKLADVFNLASTQNDSQIYSLEEKMESVYHPQLGFRSAMMAGNFVVIFVMLLGLLGYTSSEGNRRAKELAIRKVNGAELKEIIWLFLKEVVVLAIPTLLIGLTGAWILSHRWMESFAKKVDLTLFQFITTSVIIFLVIVGISIVNYTKISNANPVNSLSNSE